MNSNSRPNGLTPISIPKDWDDDALLTFEQFCALIQIPPRTVRDWRRRKVGVRWRRLSDTGRIYTTVGEARRFVHSGQNDGTEVRPDAEAHRP